MSKSRPKKSPDQMTIDEMIAMIADLMEDLNASEEKLFLDRDNPKSISYGAQGEWGDFISGILTSVENRSLKKYPFVILNADQSISFLLHKCNEANCNECKESSTFEDSFNKSYIINQLEYQRRRFGFKHTGNALEILSKKPYNATANVLEFQLNITPDNLESILKLNSRYTKYRSEFSILKLNKKVTLKPGYISLFPVSPLDEKYYMMQAAGCQISEMPTVQLLHLLPGFNGKEEAFHYVPEEVKKKLDLNFYSVFGIIDALLHEQRMLMPSDDISPQKTDATLIFSSNDSKSDVRIVEIDPAVKDLYLMYGNIAAEELQHCRSLEVRTVVFLEKIKGNLEYRKEYNLRKEPDEIDLPKIHAIEAGLKVINEMIEIENKKMKALLTAASAPAVPTPESVSSILASSAQVAAKLKIDLSKVAVEAADDKKIAADQVDKKSTPNLPKAGKPALPSEPAPAAATTQTKSSKH